MNDWLRAALAAQVLACSVAYAEPLPGVAVDPADAKIAVPEPRFESAFDGYRRDVDPKLRVWREANDEAAALGGHRGQLRAGHVAPSEVRKNAAPTRKPSGGAR